MRSVLTVLRPRLNVAFTRAFSDTANETFTLFFPRLTFTRASLGAVRSAPTCTTPTMPMMRWGSQM